MICKKCGATIEDNSTECKFCGAKYPENEAKSQPEPAEVTEPAENADDTKVIDTETVNAAAAATVAASDEEEYSGEEIDRMLDENEKNRRRQQDRLNAEKQKQLLEIEKRRQQKRKKQIRNRLLIALAILIVLGGVGSGVYYLQTQNGGVPEVEVVTEAPEITPDVVSEAQTEEPAAEATEAPAEATQQPDWQNSGAASTGAAAGVSGGAAAGGSTNKSAASGGSANQSSGTAKSTAPASGGSTKQSGTASASASTGSKNTVSTSSAQPKAGTKYSAKGGYDGEKFNAALVTGKEVVTGGSKKYLAFDFNGTTYYANIDSGSSTADVAGKPMTINAYKTNEVYNGVSVYEITALTKYNSSYVFPESGYRLLTEADLKGKSARELYIGRNEIYARHGRQFTDKSLQTYFNSCSWYKIKTSYNTANDAANLNSIELANATFIKKYEDSHK